MKSLLLALPLATALLAIDGLAADLELDLSAVEGLSRSDDYRVFVDGREVMVYKTMKRTNHGTNGITTMSFTVFDIDGPAEIRVEPSAKLTSVEIRPYSAEIRATREGNSVLFPLTEPSKLALFANGSYESALLLFANRPQAPPDPETVEHYFAPGIHRPGRVRLESGDDVYLAPGAVVEGCFDIRGTDAQPIENVTIRGRGVLSLGKWPHQENFRVFRGDNTRNVLIEGIVVTDAPGWIVSFWGKSNRDLTVRDVKMVGNYRYNTDGVQTGTDGLLVEDCFLQTNDDTFSLNGLCRNVTIRNSVFWNIYNGGVFMMGWATGGYNWADWDIHDNVILAAGGCCEYDRKAPFSLKTFTSGTAKNLVFRNIVVEDVRRYGRWLDLQMKQPGTIEGITFENIDIRKMWRVGAEIRGFSPEAPIADVEIRSLRIAGEPVKDAKGAGFSLIHSRGVTIDGKAQPNQPGEEP